MWVGRLPQPSPEAPDQPVKNDVRKTTKQTPVRTLDHRSRPRLRGDGAVGLPRGTQGVVDRPDSTFGRLNSRLWSAHDERSQGKQPVILDGLTGRLAASHPTGRSDGFADAGRPAVDWTGVTVFRMGSCRKGNHHGVWVRTPGAPVPHRGIAPLAHPFSAPSYPRVPHRGILVPRRFSSPVSAQQKARLEWRASSGVPTGIRKWEADRG